MWLNGVQEASIAQMGRDGHQLGDVRVAIVTTGERQEEANLLLSRHSHVRKERVYRLLCLRLLAFPTHLGRKVLLYLVERLLESFQKVVHGSDHALRKLNVELGLVLCRLGQFAQCLHYLAERRGNLGELV